MRIALYKDQIREKACDLIRVEQSRQKMRHIIPASISAKHGKQRREERGDLAVARAQQQRQHATDISRMDDV